MWKASRQTKAVSNDVLGTLHAMIGPRLRCMYCEDSRATDVEHFWPKADFPEFAYDWDNMLLVCTPCQRYKGSAIPLDCAGQMVFIDPTSEDPWDVMTYVPETGMITPRFFGAAESTKARETIERLRLRDECVTDARKEIFKILREAVATFLSRCAEPGDGGASLAESLKGSVRSHLQFGLAQWCFEREGREREPFSRLRAEHPAVFEAIQAICL
jgi:uncharacterized protein (TIGR02646 family)